ncbi:MAG: hypothetical protein EA001_06450 [Oscillatoriales cyanobacterium]|nr:MAG: hypothetical protein EA001_06450 [Oscillatoriales cyanobacterium]
MIGNRRSVIGDCPSNLIGQLDRATYLGNKLGQQTRMQIVQSRGQVGRSSRAIAPFRSLAES